MNKELAQLIGNIFAILTMVWIGRRIWVGHPGIFSNRLKTIKREREQDKDSALL